VSVVRVFASVRQAPRLGPIVLRQLSKAFIAAGSIPVSGLLPAVTLSRPNALVVVYEGL
jgi:hypothetical protein